MGRVVLVMGMLLGVGRHHHVHSVAIHRMRIHHSIPNVALGSWWIAVLLLGMLLLGR